MSGADEMLDQDRWGPVPGDLVDRLRGFEPPLHWDDDALLADAADEIERLRQALVFADGACVVGNGCGLADLYNETTHFQGVLARAGCHPRGREHAVIRLPSDGDS